MRNDYYSNSKDYINRWVVSYADLVTMLLALFMVLFAISQNVTKYQAKIINENDLKIPENVAMANVEQLEELKTLFDENISQSDNIKFLKEGRGLVIRLNNRLLFDEGYRYYFETIIFAIYDKGEKKNFNAFSEVFWNVSAKLSLDYDYGEQNFAEISATSANFYQNVFPRINFNFSAENFDEKNIGYAHGMMKNGLPFTAELWEYENVKNVAFYLPVIEEFFNVDEEIEKNKSKKVTGFSFDEEVQGFHSLCVGMTETYSIASHEILDKYIDLLIECDLLKFTTDMRNGYGFILQDSADNEFFCFTLSLQHESEETAFTPLKWIPFKKNKPSELHLIK